MSGDECGAGYFCTDDGYCKSSGNGGGPDTEIDASCPAVHFMAKPTIPSIQLLIDRSGSMLHNFADNTPAQGDPVKFPTEQEALVGAQGIVTQLEDKVYFGASMYPGAACPGLFTTGRALNNKTAIAALLTAHVPTSTANTPTADSIDLAVAEFMTNPAPTGSPPVIVLATDGIPNSCANDTNGAQDKTVTAAANAFSKGIRLYLLAVGTKIDPTFQKNLANAGQGVTAPPDAQSFIATDPASLATAFQTIIRGVVSCDLTLNGHVDASNASTGVVILNGHALTFNTDWKLDANGMVIHLLGGACDTLKASATPVVDASFACGGAVIF